MKNLNNENNLLDINQERGIKTSGDKLSNWLQEELPITYTELNSNIEVDVVIIGGGIAGLTIAYTISKEGKNIVLLEDGWIGSGETGRTTAHLVNALDNRYF